MGPTVLLADDHLIVRQGIKTMLEQAGLQVVGEAANGQEALRLAAANQPDVAVLDLTMTMLNGTDAARAIRHAVPKTKILILTVHREDQYVRDALQAGIDGYVLKTQATEDLLQAITEVLRGSMYLSPGISRAVVEGYLKKSGLPAVSLSPRERQTLQLIAEGHTTKEIAQVLGVTPKTAESYRTTLMTKLDIHETAGLVRYAIRHGVIQP